jgi:hypothetical protein
VADGVLELHRWKSEWLEDAEAGSIPTTLLVLEENRWRWVPADDTWTPFTDAAKLPTHDRTGCDW